MNLEVLAAEVGLSCEKHLNVLAGGVHGGGEVGRGHLVGLIDYGVWEVRKRDCSSVEIDLSRRKNQKSKRCWPCEVWAARTGANSLNESDWSLLAAKHDSRPKSCCRLRGANSGQTAGKSSLLRTSKPARRQIEGEIVSTQIYTLNQPCLLESPFCPACGLSTLVNT